MPKGNTQCCEVLLGQIRQSLAINIIFSEYIDITAKSQALEPLLQVAHLANKRMISAPSAREGPNLRPGLNICKD